ncbi:uncharacterized protein UHOD_11628 [Ustilago sp. UG-2017b]|nr:uncharacterized protein UHOD_11628 [Ustilago sp. UG-2017b]
MSNAPSCPLGGFGQVVPTAATHMGKFAFLELCKNLAEVEQDLNDTFHARHLSPGAHLENAVVEQFLHTFCDKVFLPHAYGPHSIITADDILLSPPRHDVSANRLFWKMVAKFYGAFGNHLLLRCPRKQLQLAAHHLIVSYCVVRPSEVTLAWLATDALKYCDLEFYLTLWDDDDNNEQDDDDNELMEDDGGMLVVWDSGHEVQPSQHRRTRYHLGCEVTFHNLKDGQTNPNTYRTQPLYGSGSPACMEPTIILAQLAEENGVFDHGISIVSVMETADPEYFKNVDEFLPIPIKAEAKDCFVLRAIKSASSSGRGTTSVAMGQHQSATSTSTLLAAGNNGPTSSSKWVVSELAPWNTSMSRDATRKIALATGMPEYTMYSLRRMTIQTLDCTLIVKSYLSRRNVVDIQGLVQRGKESKNHIMLHGLHHVKAITDTPNSLHAIANAGVESMPIIQRLVHKYNQAKVALSDASAQGLPAHEYQTLKVDVTTQS